MAGSDDRFDIGDVISTGSAARILHLGTAPADVASIGGMAGGHGRFALLLDGQSLASDDNPPAGIAFGLLTDLARRGYRTGGLPGSLGVFRSRLGDASLVREDGVSLSCIDYAMEFASLPANRRAAVEARWGTAERDRRFLPGRTDCGRFSLPVLECGDVAIGLLRAAGEPVPRHWGLALAFWLASDFRATTVAFFHGGNPQDGAVSR